MVPQPHNRRRGLAGTVLVHKVAGATAARGGSLEEVKAAALKVSGAVSTLGVCLKVCTLPGKQPSDRLGEGEIEIGLGIHGELPFSSLLALLSSLLSLEVYTSCSISLSKLFTSYLRRARKGQDPKHGGRRAR